MMQAWRVRDWNENFETHESRKRKHRAKWVAQPTNHEGKRFRRFIRLDNSGALYGAWCLILQVAAKCRTRGLLVDDRGEPLTVDDLEDMTGVSAEIFAKTMEAAASDRIGWLERVNLPGARQIDGETAALAADCAGTHPKRGSTKPDQDTTEQDMTPTNGGGALQPFGDVWLVGKIEPGELADDTAMIRLLIDQLNRPLNDVAEADVLRWFAAAEHARSTPGIGNREGLFQSTIMSPLGSDAWKRITENEEQAAHHRYKRMRGLHVCRRRTDDPVAEVLGDDQ